MKQILIPVDFLTASENAVRYTENIFKNQPVSVVFVHISINNENDGDIKKSFEDFKKHILKDSKLPYTFHIIKGDLLEGIQNAIHEFKPSVVVMGIKGTALSKAFVKLTDCPILFVPEGAQKIKISNIVYANDFNSIHNSDVLAPLLDFSRAFDANIHIIHINKDEHVGNDEAEDSLEYYLNQVNHEYASIKSDDMVKAIQDYIAEKKIDLLTVLLRDHGDNDLHTKGRLVEELVSKTNVPILNLV